METPIPKDLMNYLDRIKDKNPGDITDAEVVEFIKITTKDIDTFCYMIDYVDRWDRTSNEFRVATAMHIAAYNKDEDSDPLGVEYMKYYHRAVNPNDYAGKLVQELVESAEERYGTSSR